MRPLLYLTIAALALGQQDDRTGAPAYVGAYVIPAQTAARYKNFPDPQSGEGSCVQASLSYLGAHFGQRGAECLLRNDPIYGPPELGGSWPERVTEYCQRRRIPMINVEGPRSLEVIDACLLNGYPCAITYGEAHMICAVGMMLDRSAYFIWDNNFPTIVRRVSREVFVREHRSYGGGWVVCLTHQPGAPWQAPAWRRWWESPGTYALASAPLTPSFSPGCLP